jgi:hypothetical protein
MKLHRQTILGIGISALLAVFAAGTFATDDDDDDGSPAPRNVLKNCEDWAVDGVQIKCPANLSKARIVQVFNPSADKGTSTSSACVCNATFVQCDPNKTSNQYSSDGASSKTSSGLPACNLGFIQAVPSEASLMGNNTTYCETIGAVRYCYSR